jgi:curved DNA-binding protein CbpA
MDSSDNPYEILGISSDADETAIKKAYRQEARIHHPDKQKTDKDRERATAEFAKIADAYDLLQDPVRRYDWRMSQQGKIKSTPQKPSSPARSTTSTATMTRTSINAPPTRTSIPPTASMPVRKRPTASMPVRKRASSMPVAKRASAHPNSERVSPPSVALSTARTSSVRTALPPNTRRSTLRPPLRPQPSQSMQGGRRANLNTTGMRMRNSTSMDSDLLNLRRPAGGRKTTGMPMQNSMSVESDMHKLRRPAGGRKKSQGTSPTRNPVSRNKPRNALDAHSEHIPRTRKPGRMNRDSLDTAWRDSLDTRSCHTPREKKTPVKQGKLNRTLSLRSMASSTRSMAASTRSMAASTRSMASSGSRVSAGSRLVW